jgi:nicotinamidase-related amidase
MALLHCPVDDATLAVVDIQPSFMQGIHEMGRVVRRAGFLIDCAHLLGVPVVSTEQYPSRMGGMDPMIGERLKERPFSKMAFSCCGSSGFKEAIEATGRRAVVLIGIETHICVTLTALDLLEAGYRVFVCPDAVSARSVEMHKLGMERMRDSGAIASHTETLVYEWMGSAENPRFRDVLALVKNAAS